MEDNRGLDIFLGRILTEQSLQTCQRDSEVTDICDVSFLVNIIAPEHCVLVLLCNQ